MSDGMIICINVLRSVFNYLEKQGIRLRQKSESELFDVVEEYALSLGIYLESLDIDGRRKFREFRGSQGQTRGTRECQQGIQKLISHFDPQGLKEFIELEGAQTNSKALSIVESIESMLRDIIIEDLKNAYGDEQNHWWPRIPMGVRLNINVRFERDDRKRGTQEEYLEIGDYKPIVLENWDLFESTLAYGKGAKVKRVQWLQDVADAKKIVCISSASTPPLPIDRLTQLEQYQKWLNDRVGDVNDADESFETESDQDF